MKKSYVILLALIFVSATLTAQNFQPPVGVGGTYTINYPSGGFTTFSDDGGPGGTLLPNCGGVNTDGAPGNYSNCGCTQFFSICPDVASNPISLSFLEFSVLADFDHMIIYDGTSTAAPVLFDGSTGGSAAEQCMSGGTTFSATNPSGCLYIEFVSTTVVNSQGFMAQISNAAAPACFPPNSLTAGGITTTAATLTWTDPNSSVTGWQVSYGPSPTAPGGGQDTIVLSNSVNLSGLTSATSYDWSVRAICAPGDTSSWASPASFTTLCTPFTAPYSQNFDGVPAVDPFGGIPCWSITGPGQNDVELSDSPDFGVDPAPSAPNSIEMSPGDWSSGDSAFVVSPQFTDLPSGLNRIRFQAAFESLSGNVLYVGVMTDPNSSATFVPIDTIVPSFIDVYQEYTVNLDNTGLIGAAEYIGFAHGPTFNDVYIDDFVYEAIPACPNPTAFGVDSVSNSEVFLSWTNGGSETNWVIEAGFAPLTSGPTFLLPVPSNPFTVTGLDPNAEYEFQLAAVCAPGDTSPYVGPVAARTNPAPPTPVNCVSGGNASVVFTEEFAGPGGWTGDLNGGNGEWEIPGGATSTGTGPDSEFSGPADSYMNFEATGTGPYLASVVSPAIDLTSGQDDATLSFWMHAFGADIGTLTVGVGTSPIGPFTTVFTWSGELQTAATDPWVNVGADLTSFLGDSIYLEFEQDHTGSFEGDMSIDLIEVSTCLSCVTPTALTEPAISTTDADLAWTDGNVPAPAGGWEISYGPTPNPAGSGTLVVTGSNPFNLSGLSAATSYDWAVRAICAPGDTSSWSPVSTFITPCATFTAPYSQNFDGATAPQQPYASGVPCWSTIGPGANDIDLVGTSGGIDFGVDDPPSLPNAFELNDGNLSAPDTAILVSPQFTDLPSGSNRIRFQYTGEGTASFIYIGVLTDPTSTASFTIIDSIPTPPVVDSYTEVVVNLDNTALIGSAEYVGFMQGATSLESYIDDFVYEPIPTCLAPTALTTNAVNPTDADLAWTDNSTAGSYEISYGVSPTAPGSGIIVPAGTNPFILSGLSAATSYDWAVRAICAPGDTSAWSASATFVTTCLPFTAPYSQNFDAATAPQQPYVSGVPCWSTIGPGANDIDLVGTSGGIDFGVDDPPSLPNAFELNDGDITDPDTSILVSPQFTDLPSGLNRIRFQYTGEDVDAFIYIGVLTDPTNTTSFTIIDSIPTPPVVDSYTEVVVNLDNTALIGSAENIGFMHGPDIWESYIDDFVYEAIPGCPSPTLLTSTGVTDASVDLAWTNGASETAWVVEWGETPLGSSTTTLTAVGSNPFTVTGLNADTEYDFRLAAVCAPGDTSGYTDTLTVRTAPAPPPALNCVSGGNPSVVFTEEFDDAQTNGWTGDFGTTCGEWESPDGSTSSNTGADNAFSGVNYMNYEASSGCTTRGAVVSPPIDLTNGQDQAVLSFWMHAFGENMGTLEVGVGTSPTGPFTNVFTWNGELQTSGSDPWVNAGADITSFLGQTIYVEFAHTHSGVSFEGDMSIDLFEISTCQSCAAPGALTASNFTTSGVDLSWTDANGAGNYELSYGPVTTPPGGGTVSTETSTSVSLSSLASGTYDWHVRTICGPGDTSDWSSSSFIIPVAGDLCDVSVPITVFPTGGSAGNESLVNLSGLTSSAQSSISGCDDTGVNTDYFFEFTASDDSLVILTDDVTGFPTNEWAIWDICGGTVGGASLIDCGSNDATVTGLTVGSSYILQVWDDGTSTDVQSWALEEPAPLPPPITNDDCASADPITVYPDGGSVGLESIADHGQASASTQSSITGCDDTGTNLDLFYQFTMPAGETEVNILTGDVTGTPTNEWAIWDVCGGTPTAILIDCGSNDANVSGLTGGSSYILQVWDDGPSSDVSSWALELPPPPTPGSDCSSPLPVLTVYPNGGSVGNETSGTTVGESPSAFDPSCDAFGTNLDFFYEFTMPPGETTVEVLAGGVGGSSLEAAVWDVCGGAPTATEFGCLGTGAGTITGLTGGATYVLQVWHDDFNADPYTVALELPPPPPANDQCTSAAVVTCGDALVGESTVGATDANASALGCANLGDGVWYEFAGTGEVVTVEADPAAGFDLELAVATSNDCINFTNIDCQDGSGSGGIESITFPSVVGETYYIYVGYFGTTTDIEGDFDLSVTCVTPPANDEIAGAVSVTCGSTTSGTTTNATQGSDESTFCGTSVTTEGVWYEFTGTGDQITASTCDAATFDTKISVYTGTSGSLTCVGGNDDFTGCTGGTSQVSFTSTVGTTYWILVHGFGGQTGDFDLSITCTTPPPPHTNVWNGSAGDGDWTNTSNWNDGVVPVCGDSVFIDNVTFPPIITTNVACGYLGTASGSDVSVQITGQLDVCGNAVFGANFEALGDGEIVLTGASGGSTVDCNATARVDNVRTTSDYSLNSGTLRIGTGLSLDGGDWTNNAETILLSDNGGTAWLDDFSGVGSYNGDITVQMYVRSTSGPLEKQHFIASPVNAPGTAEIGDDLNGPLGVGLLGADGVAVTPLPSCDVNNLAAGSNYGNLFELQEDNITFCYQERWVVRSAGGLTNGEGYSAWLRANSTAEWTGTPNTGAVSGPSLTSSGASTTYPEHYRWNLVGNPFPSPVDVTSFLTANGSVNSPSQYEPSGPFAGTYQGYAPGSNVAINQGFMVQASAAGPISFDNTMRSTGVSEWKTGETWFDSKLDIEVHGGGFADRTHVFFNEEATADFDVVYDRVKVPSDAGQPTLYTETYGEEMLNYNGRNTSDLGGEAIPLGVAPGADGSFELRFSGMESFLAGTVIYLHDTETDTYTDLRSTDVYSFEMEADDASDRFELVFEKSEDDATGIDALAGSGIEIYSHENVVTVDLRESTYEGLSDVVIHDLLGQAVAQSTGLRAGRHSIEVNSAGGYYFVMVTQGSERYTKQVVIIR